MDEAGSDPAPPTSYEAAGDTGAATSRVTRMAKAVPLRASLVVEAKRAAGLA
jgi:hypothetical protein